MNSSKLPMNFQIIIVALLLFSLGMGIGVLWPKYTEFTSLKNTVKAKEAQFAEGEEYFAELAKAEEELAKYQRSLDKIDAALPDYPALASLFHFIQQASSQTGLILRSVSPPLTGSAGKGSQLKKTEANVQVAGSYPSFKQFVSTLEKSARLIEIENISFTNSEQGQQTTFNIRVKVFSY